MEFRQPKRRRTGSRATLQFTFNTQETCEAFKAKVEGMKRLLALASGPPLDNLGLMSTLFEIAEVSLAQRQPPPAPQLCSSSKTIRLTIMYCTWRKAIVACS